MALAARCPECSTAFRIVPDQLKISEGWVRCGHCNHVFNAQASQYDVPEAILAQTLREQGIQEPAAQPPEAQEKIPYKTATSPIADDSSPPSFHDSLLSEFHIGWADTLISNLKASSTQAPIFPAAQRWGSNIKLDDGITLDETSTEPTSDTHSVSSPEPFTPKKSTPQATTSGSTNSAQASSAAKLLAHLLHLPKSTHSPESVESLTPHQKQQQTSAPNATFETSKPEGDKASTSSVPWWTDETSTHEQAGRLKRRLFPLEPTSAQAEKTPHESEESELESPFDFDFESELSFTSENDLDTISPTLASLNTPLNTPTLQQQDSFPHAEIITISDTDFMLDSTELQSNSDFIPDTSFMLEEKPSLAPADPPAPKSSGINSWRPSSFFDPPEESAKLKNIPVTTEQTFEQVHDNVNRHTQHDDNTADTSLSKTAQEVLSSVSLPAKSSSTLQLGDEYVRRQNTGKEDKVRSRKSSLPSPSPQPSQKSRTPSSSNNADLAPENREIDLRYDQSYIALEDTASSLEDEPALDLSFIRKAEQTSLWQHPAISAACTFLFCVLSVTLLIQISVLYRDKIATEIPALRPALSAICQPFHCTVDYPKNIQDITIDGSSFETIASRRYALDLLLRNKNSSPIALPWVELSLNDSTGQTVVTRALSPQDLGITQVALRPGEELFIKRDLLVDIDDIRGFNIVLFYP